jgi:hypothetical protein
MKGNTIVLIGAVVGGIGGVIAAIGLWVKENEPRTKRPRPPAPATRE